MKASLRAAFPCLVALAFLGACSGRAQAPKAGGPGAGGAMPALPVTVLEVHERKVPISLEAVGQAQGSREVEIRSRVTGILEKRVYDEGAAVKKGAVLFTIERAPYRLAVEGARATLQQQVVARDLARVDAKRLEPLAREKAISQRELDQALATEKTAAAAIASARAKLDEAELNLSYTKVTAPISGITGRALQSEGALVTANTASALLTTLTRVDPIWVLFPLAESDYKRIRGAERTARVQIVDERGKVLAGDGRLNFASTAVDARTGAVQLRAEFPNPRAHWLPGQFARVRILAGEQTAMLVPQSAVLQTEQSRVVMTVGPGDRVVPKPVETGNWIGSDIVVTGGLQDGDRVILDNLVKLRPGAPVQPHAPGAAPAQPAGAPGAAGGAPKAAQ